MGVHLTTGGAIDIDDYMRTSAPHIFAIGDVTAKVQLAHVASAQGVIAAETIAGAADHAVGLPHDATRDRSANPKSPASATPKTRPAPAATIFESPRFPCRPAPKRTAWANAAGFIKLIADAAHGELLGAHLVGAEVSELLPELTADQLWDLTATELARNVHTHPTLGEGLQECFHALDRARHQPMTPTACRALTTRQPRNAERRPALHNTTD